MLGVVAQVLAKLREQPLQQIDLRGHRDILAHRHRGRSRHQRSQAGELHHVRAHLRARHAEDERDVGDQAVAHAQHRRAGRTALNLARLAGVFVVHGLRGGSSQ